MELFIENFQSIANAKLDISGFTAVSGPSDLGKSAMCRAFGNLLYNEWSEDYIRKGTNETTVSLRDGDTVISVHKSTKGRNEYNCFGKKYQKVGTAVPDYFEELGFTPLDVDGSKYNLQVTSQLEPLFMISYRPVENTRILNKVFDVTLFENANKLAVSDIRTFKAELKLRESDKKKEYENYEKQKEEYEKLNIAVKKLEEIYQSTELIVKYTKAIAENEKHKDRAKQCKSVIRRIERLEDIKKYLDSLSSLETANSVVASSSSKLKLLSGMSDIYEILSLVRQSNLQKKSIKTSTEKLRLISKYGEYTTISDFLNKVQNKSTLQYTVSLLEIDLKDANKFDSAPDLSAYLLKVLELRKTGKLVSTCKSKLLEVQGEIGEYGVCECCGRAF